MMDSLNTAQPCLARDITETGPGPSPLASENLFELERILTQQWRAGDAHAGLRSVERAIWLNPRDPDHHFFRGAMRQIVGMTPQAMQDFETALRLAKDETVRSRIESAIRALEDWQAALVRLRLSEDRNFRMEFAVDARAALTRAGFVFSPATERAVLISCVRSEETATQAGFA